MRLARKILYEKHEEIPSFYSDQIKALVDLLLKKDINQRADLKQIFELPLIKSHS